MRDGIVRLLKEVCASFMRRKHADLGRQAFMAADDEKASVFKTIDNLQQNRPSSFLAVIGKQAVS
jgi:hypothetical protein